MRPVWIFLMNSPNAGRVPGPLMFRVRLPDSTHRPRCTLLPEPSKEFLMALKRIIREEARAASRMIRASSPWLKPVSGSPQRWVHERAVGAWSGVVRL